MIISVAHQKGGVGKSSIVWHLAHTLKPDIVVDLDDQHTVTAFNNIRSASGKQSLPVLSPTDQELIDILAHSEESLVLIDTGGFDSETNRLAIAGADLVIIPFADTPAEVLGLQRLKSILEEIQAGTGEPVNHACVVNRANPRRRNFKDLHETLDYLGLSYLKTAIPANEQHISQCCGNGLSVHESSGKQHQSSKVFTALTKEVNERVIHHAK